MLCGAILIHAAEQAYAHAWLIGFPHQLHASELLLPASVLLLIAGLAMILWGIWGDVRERNTNGTPAETTDGD